MLTPKEIYITPPTTTEISELDKIGIAKAIEEASIGLSEGGVPIGACLMDNTTGKILGSGRNRRVQQNSAIRHGETDCLENIGRLKASVYANCTMYTSLSACSMCTGAIILYGIKRVVIGENSTFTGGEGTLKDHGVEIINLNLDSCKELMAKFIKAKPEVWNEDIGE